jgi:hypothetical protein
MKNKMKRYIIIAEVDLPNSIGIESKIEMLLGDSQFDKFKWKVPDNAEINVDIEEM